MTHSFSPLVFKPVRKPRPEPAKLRARASADDPEAPRRVLVVDDDPAIHIQVTDMLKEPDFLVETTSSAAAFFEAFDRAEPAVALVDLSLPGRDGIDILKQLCEIGYDGEVLLMSAASRHVLETTRRMASVFGLIVQGVVQKPFTARDLFMLLGQSQLDATGDSRIRSALAAEQIRPYFQPKIDIATGRVAGAEALSRWHHPERGILMPGGYMGAVRAAGSQSVHDYRILECTMALCAKVNAMGQRIKFSVNFTADNVLGDYFLDVIKDAQVRHGVHPDQLVIELTETDTVENFDALTERLLKLRLSGVHLSIDDFGTGHSSLSRIQRLPVSELKIDRSFVNGLTEYSDDYAIVRSIIELAHSFNCPVVAEGVETLESLEVLKKLGCDMAQGFIFSPAVNEATFCALLSVDGPRLGPPLAAPGEGPLG